MELELERSGNTLLIKIKGKLIVATAEDLQNAIESSVDDDVNKLILDISEMEYLSSAGLRVFLIAQSMMDDRDGEMEVTGANEMVKETFSETGFDLFLNLKQ